MFIFLKNNNTNNGDYMKKLIIFLILLSIIFFIDKKEKIIDVFNENNYYEIYYLDFRNTNLTTNNFIEYFNNKNIDILKIQPYINPIYRNKISFYEYQFDYSGINSNIKKLKDKYLSELKIINYDEYVKYRISGIKIDMVKVYAREEDIIKILNKDKSVKYMFNYIDYSKV